MEHAGVVAGVQAVAVGPAILAIPEVGATVLEPHDTVAYLVPQFLQVLSDHTDSPPPICCSLGLAECDIKSKDQS